MPRIRFSPEDVQRIVGLTRKQLDHWDRLRLVSPQIDEGTRYYDFRDLIGLRTVKQLLEKGVSANRLQRALSALNEKLSQVKLRFRNSAFSRMAKTFLWSKATARLEPLSGQFVLNFETRELDESVRFIAQRSADDWLAMALSYEADKKTRAKAIECVRPLRGCRSQECRRTSELRDALLRGRKFRESRGLFPARSWPLTRKIRWRISISAASWRKWANWKRRGRHLRQAVLLDPSYSDAHYNLAFVCEKLQAFAEAREHWQVYVQLDPVGPWAGYARQRLAAGQSAKLATT